MGIFLEMGKKNYTFSGFMPGDARVYKCDATKLHR